MDNQPPVVTTPPTPGQMTPAEEAVTSIPVVGWGHRKLILALLISLLLPPIGILLMLYLLIKAIRTSVWRKAALLPAIAVLILSAAGTYGYWQLYQVWQGGKQYSYTYSKLDDFKLPSVLKGAGISFNKPTEFIQAGDSVVQEGFSAAIFYQPNYATDPKTAIAYLSANSVQSALAASSSYVEQLSSVLNNPSDSRYQTMVGPVKDFLVAATDSSFRIDIGSAKPLQTANLKNNAWEFDFFIQNDKNKTKVTPLRGKAILAVGKNSFYYFMVSSVYYNWGPSQSVWQQMIDSIKIDQ